MYKIVLKWQNLIVEDFILFLRIFGLHFIIFMSQSVHALLVCVYCVYVGYILCNLYIYYRVTVFRRVEDDPL